MFPLQRRSTVQPRPAVSNFIGGYSALVQKGFATGDELLLRAIPQALAETDLVCSSVNVGSTKAGINMDAVARMGRIVKQTAQLTRETDGLGCAKLVVFCNAVEDNPFMAGAFHGVGEADSVINVGVSGPGVVYHALQKCKGQPFDVVAETIKKTAFQITRMGQLVATGGVPPARYAVRHRRPLARADARHRRQRRPHSGGDGSRRLRHARHDRRARTAQRRGEEGRRHGLWPRRRPFRRVHPRLRGRGHDRRRAQRCS